MTVTAPRSAAAKDISAWVGYTFSRVVSTIDNLVNLTPFTAMEAFWEHGVMLARQVRQQTVVVRLIAVRWVSGASRNRIAGSATRGR